MSEEELPEGWTETHLGDLIEGFQSGRSLSGEGRPAGLREIGVLKISAVTWGEFNPSENKALPAGTVPRDYERIHRGDLLISRANTAELVGAVVRVKDDHPNLMLPDKLLRIVLRTNVDPDFVKFALRTPAARAHLEDNATGTSQSMRNLSQPKMAATPLWLPSLAEQRRIVEKVEALLAEVNAVRARLAKIPTILKRFRQSILAAACSGRLTEDWRERAAGIGTAADLVASVGKRRRKEVGEVRRNADNIQPALRIDLDLPELPQSWQWVDLRFLMSPNEDFCYGVVQPGADDPAGPRLIRVCDVERGRVSKSDLRGIPSSVHAQYARSVVRGGEILVSVVGTIGRAAIVPADLAGANIARAVAKVPVREFDADYVCRWLATSQAELWMVGDAREVARKTLNLEQLRTLPVPLPPIPEQHEIVRRVDALFKLADAIEARVAAATARADKITQAILAKAFRGELVPTEAELARQEGRDYEPASALLARIRATRAANDEKPTRRPRVSTATAAPATANPGRRKTSGRAG